MLKHHDTSPLTLQFDSPKKKDILIYSHNVIIIPKKKKNSLISSIKKYTVFKSFKYKRFSWELSENPGSLVIMVLGFHCQDPESIPGRGTEPP